MKTKENLKNYWWFRLLKVFYILGFATSVILVVIIAIGEKPVLNKYLSTYQFKCNVDGVLRGNIEGSYFNNYKNISFKDDGIRDLTRFICIDPSIINSGRSELYLGLEEARIKGIVPKSDNFVLLVKNPIYYGSWSSFFSYLIIGNLGVFVVFYLIKVFFMYIVVGSIPKVPFTENVLKLKYKIFSNPKK